MKGDYSRGRGICRESEQMIIEVVGEQGRRKLMEEGLEKRDNMHEGKPTSLLPAS